jgi:hypothetical protein
MKIATVLGAALSVGGAAPPARPDVASLGWMSGRWVEEKGGRWTEESWSAPRGGVMLGTGVSGKGGKADDWEYMRIAADGQSVAFWGSPRGKPAVPFRLVSASESEVAFENPKHDYPTRIGYRRSGDVLVATISGPGGAKSMSWRYRKR